MRLTIKPDVNRRSLLKFTRNASWYTLIPTVLPSELLPTILLNERRLIASSGPFSCAGATLKSVSELRVQELPCVLEMSLIFSSNCASCDGFRGHVFEVMGGKL